MPTGLMALTCSAAELSFLAGLLGAEGLLGVPDPFPGWLTEEIDSAWREAREALASRGVLRVGADRSIRLEPEIVDLLLPCVRPDAVLILRAAVPGEPTATWVGYVAGESAVQMVCGEKGYYLAAVDGAHGLSEQLLAEMRLTASVEPDAPGGVLHVNQLTPEGVASSQLDDRTKAALSETLARPVRNSALVVMLDRQGRWEVDGLGFLAGSNGLWLLRSVQSQGEELVQVMPCTGGAAAGYVSEALEAVLG